MKALAVLALLFVHGQAAALPRPQGLLDLLSSDTQAYGSAYLAVSAFPEGKGASVRIGSQLNSSFCRKTLQVHPNSIHCPDSCPYLRHEATGNCLFKCVHKEQCKNDDPLNSFADDRTMRCMSCRARACEQCGSDAYTCKRCHGSYELADGSCVYRYRGWWYFIYAVIAVVFSFVACYVVCLAMRPAINDEAAEHAIRFRNTSKIIEEATGKPHKIIKTDVRRMYVNGVGTMLHFQWQYAVLWWSILVLTLLGFVALRYPRLPDVQSEYDSRDEMFGVCNAHVKEQAIYFNNLEHAFFYVVLVIYVASTVGCLAFALWQKRWANKRNANLTTMQDYVLIASGFPQKPGSEPIEEDVKEFFEEVLAPIGAKVVGVSVCWDTTNLDVKVEDLALRETDKAELMWEAEQGLVKSRVEQHLRRKSRTPGLATTPASGGQPGLRSSEITTTFEENVKSQRRNCGVQCGFVDSALCFQDLRKELPDDCVTCEDADSERQLQNALDKSVSSGSCYVVLNTEKARDDVYDYCRKNPLRFPSGVEPWCQDRISVSKVGELEPEVVVWSSYGIPDSQVTWNMVKGVGFLILVIVVLDVCLYFPYMSYVIKMQEVRGMSQGDFTQGFFLGLLITVCNQVIYALALMIADNCGFKTKDEHTKFYVIAYTAAVSINTFVDLWAVSLLARGYVVDHGEFVDDDAGMSMKALAENYALQMSLYQQMWAYIFPGTLLAPYICEPLVVATLFRLRLWIVRSRKIPLMLAEELLQCPPFDLARYGDILIIAILCSALLLFTYRDLWTIFACAVVSLLWIYNLDRFRLLRFSSRANFVNQRLSDLAHLLMAFPCAVLSACVIFRAYATQSGDDFMQMYYKAHDKTYHIAADPFRKTHSEVDRFLTRDTVVMVMITAGALHLLVHWSVLTWLVPYFGDINVQNDKEVPYAKCSEEHPCNWFNANPMFCLRSKYYYQHEVPCIQFKPGKEHMLQVNHSIGQHFRPTEFFEQATEEQDKGAYLKNLTDQVFDEINRIRKKAVNIKRTASGKHKMPTDDA